MTKRRKIIIGVISLGILLMLTVLFLLIPRPSNISVESLAPPREVTPVSLPPPIPSTLNVKVDIPLSKVSGFAKSAISDHVREPIQWKDSTTTASINLRPGDPTLTNTTDGKISVKIPIQISGSAESRTTFLFEEIDVSGVITGQALVSLTLTPRLHPDWRITAKIDADIVVQNAVFKTTELYIFNRTVSIRERFAQAVKKTVLPDLKKHIAKYIANIDLKTHAANVWTKLYKPIVLNREPRILLTMKPLEISAQQLSGDGTNLSLTLGIKAFIHVNVGDVSTDSPSAVGPRDDLPNLHLVDSLQAGSHIIAPIEVTYAVLENLAKPHIEKAHNRKSIILENLTLYGSGTHLAAGVGFRIPISGTAGQLYLLGTPMSDATAVSVSITKFDYAFTTQNRLLEIFENIGEEIFANLRTGIEEKLVLKIPTLHETLSDAIASQPMDLYVLRGTISTVVPEAPYLTQTGVIIPLRLQGDLNCQVDIKSSQFP